MIHAWGITDKGAVRTQNQDGFYLDVPSEHLAVGVVCDGMGGAKAGNIASLIAVETFVDALQGMQPDGDGEAGPAAVLSRAGGDRQIRQSITGPSLTRTAAAWHHYGGGLGGGADRLSAQHRRQPGLSHQ